MRRAVMLAIVAALAAAPRALAHVTLAPTRADPGADVLLTLVVPNESKTARVTGVTVRVPPGFSYETVSAPPGWRLAAGGGRTLAWSGGAVAPGRFVTFGIAGSAPARPQTLAFPVEEQTSVGVLRYRPRLVVSAPSPAAARDRGTHTLALAALAVGIAAAAAAVGAFFLALAHWLRGHDDELQES